jgi:hypothetical protein
VDLWAGNWPAPMRVYVQRTRPYAARWDAPKVLHLGAREPLLLEELAGTYGPGTYSLRPYGYAPKHGGNAWLPGATTVHLDAPPTHAPALAGYDHAPQRGPDPAVAALTAQVGQLAALVQQLAARQPADPIATMLGSIRAARSLVDAVQHLGGGYQDDGDEGDEDAPAPAAAAAPADPWAALVGKLAESVMAPRPAAPAPAPAAAPAAGPRIVGRVPQPGAPQAAAPMGAAPAAPPADHEDADAPAGWDAGAAAAALASMAPDQALAQLDALRAALPPETLLAMARAAGAVP